MTSSALMTFVSAVPVVSSACAVVCVEPVARYVICNSLSREVTNSVLTCLSTKIQLSQDFAIQQLDHYNTDVDWKNVCLSLCKTQTPDELHLSVNFLNSL